MMTLASFLLSLAGFAGLALSMVKHHRDLLGRAPSKMNRLLLGIAGWTLLMVSASPAILSQGLSVGIVLWFGIAAVAVLTVAMSLTYGLRSRLVTAKASPRNDRATVRPQAESPDP